MILKDQLQHQKKEIRSLFGATLSSGINGGSKVTNKYSGDALATIIFEFDFVLVAINLALLR